jgi:hypothetical protein
MTALKLPSDLKNTLLDYSRNYSFANTPIQRVTISENSVGVLSSNVLKRFNLACF